MTPIHSTGLEHIDGHDWELFRTSDYGTIDGTRYYYGMYVEGIGAFNVMAAQENVRDLTEMEKKYFSNKVYGIGSGFGDVSYTVSLGEIK
jgi:hypothetical protein